MLIRIKPTRAIQPPEMIRCGARRDDRDGCARECEALRFAPACRRGIGVGVRPNRAPRTATPRTDAALLLDAVVRPA
jgi:hypothetical protein